MNSKHISGIPLGGIGAGSFEMGPDGCIRQIAINNNRTSDTLISTAAGTFFAIRVHHRDTTYARFLQTSVDLPSDYSASGIQTPETQDLIWEGLYPQARYTFRKGFLPIFLRWSAFSPVIPYDVDTSTQPVVFFVFNLVNPLDVPVSVSLWFNWENICGCSKDHFPQDRGKSYILHMEPSETVSEDEQPLPPEPVGLEFGVLDGVYKTNESGQYSIVAGGDEGTTLSFARWDENLPDMMKAMLSSFINNGSLPNEMDSRPEAHSHAVCCSASIAPHGNYKTSFVFSWHCPRFDVDGEDQGNEYALVSSSAAEVVSRAMTYQEYYNHAIHVWRDRFTQSSWPRWFSGMLMNSLRTFSSNTLFTQFGKFAVFSSSQDARTGVFLERTHGSINLLLLFPHLAREELALFLASYNTATAQKRIPQYLGRLCVDKPVYFGDSSDEALAQSAIILMVWRDYIFTGRITDMRKVYSHLRDIIMRLLDMDVNNDGIPDSLVSPGAALCWLIALYVFGEMAERLRNRQDHASIQKILERTLSSYEREFWDESAGCYIHKKRSESSDQDDLMQGLLWREIFAIRHFPPSEHIHKHVSKASSNPQHYSSLLAVVAHCCAEIQYGDVDTALQWLKAAEDSICSEESPEKVHNQDLVIPYPRYTDQSGTLWYVFFMLTGFTLNVPAQELYLNPRLPKGMHSLNTPLLSSCSLGQLRWSEHQENKRYQLDVQVHFDSPVRIQKLSLAIPGTVNVADVSAEGPWRCVVESLHYEENMDKRSLTIMFEQSISLSETLMVRVTGYH